ncbi:MAG: hypothetical protein HZB39_08270 [Planctomycetes bacterium]|nr:hypothetical protein [Planctomycetota bacterium]
MPLDDSDELAKRAARARARSTWPGRVTDLAGAGRDPECASPAEALAAMDELCDAAWRLAGRPTQPLERSEWPGRVWRGGERPPEHDGGA